MLRKCIGLLIATIIPWIIWAEGIEIQQGEILDIDKCIEIALQRHPDIKAYQYNALANESKIKQARSSYYPQVSFSSGYSNTRATSMPDVTGKSFKEYIGTTTIKQTIFDFGKTSSQVEVQKNTAEASVFETENITKEVIFNVKKAYYSLLRAKKQRDLAMEIVKQYEHHLAQAKALYEVGTKPKIDVTKAEVDLSNSKLNLIKAENGVKIAKVALDNAMGIPEAPDYDIKDSFEINKIVLSLEEALQRAYENRSDLKSLREKLQSAKVSVELAKKDYYPTLTGKVTYSIPRTGSFYEEDKWDASVTLSVPLFSGFSTVYKVQEAKANFESAKYNEESLRQRIYMEVKEAYLNIIEAEERIKTAEIALRQAKENLELARNRYAVGLGSSVEMTDSMASYANSNFEYIQALYDYKIAEANLVKAMGMK